MLELFLKGLLIGFAIAAPIGPTGILCIQRSLNDGFKIGLITGMGAASADGIYGLIAAFGLTAISSMLVAHQFWIRIIGGLFLLYLGIKLLIAPSYQQSSMSHSKGSSWHAFSSALLLTLINPMVILSFIAIFAGLGLGSHAAINYSYATLLVLGITLGSAFWWVLLSGGVVFILHHRMSPRVMRAINLISGGIILAFGIFALKVLV